MPSVSLKDVQAELEETYRVRAEVDAEASNRAPAPQGDPVPSDPVKPAQPPTPTPEPVQAQPADSKTPPSPAANEPPNWEKVAKDNERRFKAIQSAITPTQMENARLRKEAEELRARLETLAPAEDPQAALDRAREILPEAVAPLENALARVSKLEDERKAEAEARADRIRRETMGSILESHADAGEIAEKDPAFWNFVDSHGQTAPFLREILEKPWAYTNEEGRVVGHEIVSELFTAYKDQKAAQNPKNPRPSDEVAPVRGTPSPAEGPSGTKTDPTVLDRRAMGRLEQRIRSGNAAEAAKVRDEILAALEASVATRR